MYAYVRIHEKLEVSHGLFHRVGDEGPEPSRFRYLSEWRLSRAPPAPRYQVVAIL